MNKYCLFGMRLTPIDRANLEYLAQRLEVPKSEAVRTLVREYVRVMQERDPHQSINLPQEATVESPAR